MSVKHNPNRTHYPRPSLVRPSQVQPAPVDPNQPIRVPLLDPETIAALNALHQTSPRDYDQILDTLEEESPQEFLEVVEQTGGRLERAAESVPYPEDVLVTQLEQERPKARSIIGYFLGV